MTRSLMLKYKASPGRRREAADASQMIMLIKTLKTAKVSDGRHGHSK